MTMLRLSCILRWATRSFLSILYEFRFPVLENKFSLQSSSYRFCSLIVIPSCFAALEKFS